MPDQSERRKFPRLNLNVGVEYKVLNEAEPLATESKDISAGGIRIILLDKIDAGGILDLNFSLPGSKETITTKGRVAWSEEFIVGDPRTGKAYEAGVEFIGISLQAQEKINQYVSTRL